MRNTAILLMLITVASRIVGFSRDLVLSYFYGASDISDAYLVAMTIPTVVFSFVQAGIGIGYIPMYSRVAAREGQARADRFTSNLTNILLGATTVLILAGLIFTTPIVKAFASGFSGDTLILAVQMTRICFWGLLFSTMIGLFTGYLQVKGNYAVPALIGFPLNLVTMLFIWLSFERNLMLLAFGAVAALVAQWLFMLPFIRKTGYRHRFVIDLKDPNLKHTLVMILPIILGVSLNQINCLVDRTIASQLAEGAISALNYAGKLNAFVQGIFVLSISTVMFPEISKMAAEGKTEQLKTTLSHSLGGINLFVIPATVGAMVFAEPIVGLLFGRGAFDLSAATMTTEALFFYSIGMLAVGYREVLSRAFYSIHDVRTPVLNATIGVVLNIILNILLAPVLGVGGLALATSVSAIVTTIFLQISLKRRMGSLNSQLWRSGFKIVAASAVMGIVSLKVYHGTNFEVPGYLPLLGAVLTGMGVYFAMMHILQIKEYVLLRKQAMSFFKKGAKGTDEEHGE